jgi:hypothetical protein
MPQRSDGAVTANEFIEQELDRGLSRIEEVFGCHAATLSGPLYQGVDDILRVSVEKVAKREPPSEKLVIVLTTGGGLLEPVQRMVLTIRRHYKVVDFIIPNYAYSAGTVFALSGDAIHMDYYSRLGPIDPQIRGDKGRMLPALGYLEKYNALIKKAQGGKISQAEVQVLLEFDQAELYDIEQARDLSIAALEEWLVEYKFKNWNKTETRGIKVTQDMKVKRARKIGKELNNTKRWHSHGYGISMDVLTRVLELMIDDFGATSERSAAIRAYSDLLDDYMSKRNDRGVIHVSGHYRPYM